MWGRRLRCRRSALGTDARTRRSRRARFHEACRLRSRWERSLRWDRLALRRRSEDGWSSSYFASRRTSSLMWRRGLRWGRVALRARISKDRWSFSWGFGNSSFYLFRKVSALAHRNRRTPRSGSHATFGHVRRSRRVARLVVQTSLETQRKKTASTDRRQPQSSSG
jgi:hypothetical protein